VSGVIVFPDLRKGGLASLYTEAQAAEDNAAMDGQLPGTVAVSFSSGGEGRLKVVIIEKETGKRMVARIENRSLPAIAEFIRLLGKGKVPSRHIPWKLKWLAGW
jgi:hypothetical protein